MSKKSLRRLSEDPGQPLVSEALAERLHQTEYQNIEAYLWWAKKEVEPYILTSFKSLREEHKTFLMYGFIAETGLHPTQCELVERHSGEDIIWTFTRKHPVDQYVQALIKEKDDEIMMLRQRLQNAQTKIAILEGKP
jgi:hypothetical protein